MVARRTGLRSKSSEKRSIRNIRQPDTRCTAEKIICEPADGRVILGQDSELGRVSVRGRGQPAMKARQWQKSDEPPVSTYGENLEMTSPERAPPRYGPAGAQERTCVEAVSEVVPLAGQRLDFVRDLEYVPWRARRHDELIRL